MKEIQLTQGKIALVDDADYDWLNQWKWCVTKPTKTSGFYAQRVEIINGQRKTVLMHRLILGLTDSKIFGDHEDHNTLNNQRYNLREATHRQNMHNRVPTKKTTSIYKGVNFNKRNKNWQALIRGGDGKRKHLGIFKTDKDAALAYNDAAKKLYGEFAYLNNILA